MGFRHRASKAGVAAALLLGAVCVLVYFMLKEPILDGQSATAWIRDLSHADKHDNAVSSLRRHGRKATPGLVSTIERRNLALASRLGSSAIYNYLPISAKAWVNERTTIADNDRVWAIRMCGVLGPEALDATKALQRAIRDTNAFVRGAAAKALADINANPATTIPLIASLLSDPDGGTRSQAAIALGRYGERSREMLPKVQALTNDPQTRVSFSARLALAMIEAPEKVLMSTNQSGEVEYRLRR